MKLRLDPKEKLPTLEVSETLSPADVAVLRAGLRKLFRSGKKEVLLDLTLIPAPSLSPLEMLLALKSLQLTASEETALLMIVSTVPELGGVASRPEALAVFNSPLSRLMNRQNQLQASIEVLEVEKKSAEEKLAALAPQQEDALQARRRNSEVKGRIKRLSAEIEEWLKTQPTKLAPRPSDPRGVMQTINSVLRSQGLLK